MIGQPQQKDDKKQEVKEAAATSSKKRKVTPVAAPCEDQITLTQIVRGKKPTDTAAAARKHETEDEANNEGIMVSRLW